MSERQYTEYLRDLRGLVVSIERLAPAVAGDGPNPEYPWEMRAPGGNMVVQSPASYLFPDFDGSNADVIAKLGKMRALLEKCMAVENDEFVD